MNKTHPDLKPQLVFRVGITGARLLREDQLTRLRAEVRHVLSHILRQLQIVAPADRVAEFYDWPVGVERPVVRLISPLAPGADRLSAQEAVALGVQLNAVLPFPQTVYEEDFKGSEAGSVGRKMTAEEDVEEFRALLKQAVANDALVELDGTRNSDEWPGGDLFQRRSYEAAGHFVVRHCDLLLAIWDGKAAKGRGGTQEIVEFAARSGVPVWWIHAMDDVKPVWIEDKYALRGDRFSAQSPPTTTADDCLTRHLNKLIPAPLAKRPEESGVLVWLANLGAQTHSDPVREYFDEKPRKERWIWGHHKRLMNLLAPERFSPSQGGSDTAGCKPVQYWEKWSWDASQHAGDYSRRYRSTYTIVICLAAFSVAFGALVPLCESLWSGRLHPIPIALELMMLLLVLFLLALSQRRVWHRRSVEYRLLAELFRMERTLAAVGWALPIGGVEHLADREWLSWVAWLMAAVQRAAPFPPCHRNDGNRTIRVDDTPLRHLLHEQIGYHEQQVRVNDARAEKLEKAGTTMFLLLTALTLFKLGLVVWKQPELVLCCLRIELEPLRHSGLTLIELLAALATAVSASCLAIRSYGELRMLAERSRTMVTDLKGALERLNAMPQERPLTTQSLGEEAGAVTLLMLQELEGWGRLFSGKLIETP
jgi:hypothetical protein